MALADFIKEREDKWQDVVDAEDNAPLNLGDGSTLPTSAEGFTPTKVIIEQTGKTRWTAMIVFDQKVRWQGYYSSYDAAYADVSGRMPAHFK